MIARANVSQHISLGDFLRSEGINAAILTMEMIRRLVVLVTCFMSDLQRTGSSVYSANL